MTTSGILPATEKVDADNPVNWPENPFNQRDDWTLRTGRLVFTIYKRNEKIPHRAEGHAFGKSYVLDWIHNRLSNRDFYPDSDSGTHSEYRDNWSRIVEARLAHPQPIDKMNCRSKRSDQPTSTARISKKLQDNLTLLAGGLGPTLA